MPKAKTAPVRAPLLPQGLWPVGTPAKPLYLLTAAEWPAWIKSQAAETRAWLLALPKAGENKFRAHFPQSDGSVAGVVVIDNEPNLWTLAGLAVNCLPPVVYQIKGSFKKDLLALLALGWSLGCYEFCRYKTKAPATTAGLVLPVGVDAAWVLPMAQAIYLARDLINTPAEDMGPPELAMVTKNLARQHGGKFREIIGDDLLTQNYPLIHAVGRAAEDAPRLLELRFGNPKHSKLTIVGKGVCFDTGGLDLKNADGMLIMKKDMGGAACALALAHLVMSHRLPVYLRVLIPAVENSVSDEAFRPMDIFRSRAGKTVEIGNTDAEGRLVLADALAAAVEEKPDLLIDFGTLTGAARVALGPELPALFCNNDKLAANLASHSQRTHDPLWRLPLWKNYRAMLDSNAADINNSGQSPMAGAITAALFLQEFVPPQIDWLHLDLYAWNATSKPGRPQGGEAMTIRAVFSLLQERYKHD